MRREEQDMNMNFKSHKSKIKCGIMKILDEVRGQRGLRYLFES